MVKVLRDWKPNEYYHVMNRGVRKEGLFKDIKDHQFFLTILDNAYKKYTIEVTSYCLMKTHYHLQIRSNQYHLSKVMHYISRSYARYYNHRYKHKGPVYESRYVSKFITDKRSILHVSRYIHYNPVPFISKTPQDYRWSSYIFYITPQNGNYPIPSYMNLSPVMDQFKGTENEKIQKYIEFCSY